MSKFFKVLDWLLLVVCISSLTAHYTTGYETSWVSFCVLAIVQTIDTISKGYAE